MRGRLGHCLCLASENREENDADNFFIHSDILSPFAENWLTKNKLGLSKTFISLSQSMDKVSPGSILLDYSFLVI